MQKIEAFIDGTGPRAGTISVQGSDDGQVGVHICDSLDGDPNASAFMSPSQAGFLAAQLLAVAEAEEAPLTEED